MGITLKPSEIKKGDIIVELGIYNFHGRNKQRQEHHHRVDKKCIYTPHTKDVYYVHEWTVHSIGKKLMRLEDSMGMRNDAIDINGESDAFYGRCFTRDAESAREIIKDWHETDEFHTPEYGIEDHRLSF